MIAGKLPGRTDNEIKNYWNTHIKRTLLSRGIDPQTHRSINESASDSKTVSFVKSTCHNFNDLVKLTTEIFSDNGASTSGTTTDEDLRLSSDCCFSEEDELNLDLTLGSGPSR